MAPGRTVAAFRHYLYSKTHPCNLPLLTQIKTWMRGWLDDWVMLDGWGGLVDMMVNGCIGKWMQGWMVGWLGIWMDEWMDRWKGAWIDGWVGGLVDGWMDGCIGERMDGSRSRGNVDRTQTTVNLMSSIYYYRKNISDDAVGWRSAYVDDSTIV